MAVYKGADRIQVEGLTQLRKELKAIIDDGGAEGIQLLKDANYEVATFVKSASLLKAAMVGKAAAKSAMDMKAQRSQVAARLVGGTNVPYFGGWEFGAKHNLIRLVKAPYSLSAKRNAKGQVTGWKKNKGRATVVRNGEDIGKVARRVESQAVSSTGLNISPRSVPPEIRNQRMVKLKRRANGQIHAVKGWNMFPLWRGNGHEAGYWLYPTIRARGTEIIDIYGDRLEDITRRAFPE